MENESFLNSFVINNVCLEMGSDQLFVGKIDGVYSVTTS